MHVLVNKNLNYVPCFYSFLFSNLLDFVSKKRKGFTRKDLRRVLREICSEARRRAKIVVDQNDLNNAKIVENGSVNIAKKTRKITRSVTVESFIY